MKKRLKTAVIGVGSMGSNHARIYSEISTLVAIADIKPDIGKQIAGKYNVSYYQDYKKMLFMEKPDAVSVVVPTIHHRDVAIDCLNLKIPTLLEKPIAPNISDAQEIIKAQQNSKTFLMIGHIERFNPAVIELKKLIEKGIFGQIVSLVVKRVGLYPPRVKDVNVVTDLAVHDLDIVCNLIGKLPVSIFATGGSGQNTHQIDYADIFLDFGTSSCYIQANWITPIKIRTLSITGTSGYGELDYISQKLSLYQSSFTRLIPQKFEEFMHKLGKSKKIAVRIQKKEPLKLELINFLNSISEKQNPTVSGKQGETAVKLAATVLESLTEKKLLGFAA